MGTKYTSPSSPELWDEFEMSDDMNLFEGVRTEGECHGLQAEVSLPFWRVRRATSTFLETTLGLIEEIHYKELNHRDHEGYVYEGPTWEEAIMERAKTALKVVTLGSPDVVYYQGERTPDCHRCLDETASR